MGGDVVASVGDGLGQDRTQMKLSFRDALAHLAHDFQHVGVFTLVAVQGRKRGCLHPAIFLSEM